MPQKISDHDDRWLLRKLQFHKKLLPDAHQIELKPFFIPVQEVSGAILTVKTLSRTFQNKEVHRTVNGGAKHGWTVEEQLMICRNWQVSDTRAEEGVTLGVG